MVCFLFCESALKTTLTPPTAGCNSALRAIKGEQRAQGKASPPQHHLHKEGLHLEKETTENRTMIMACKDMTSEKEKNWGIANPS